MDGEEHQVLEPWEMIGMFNDQYQPPQTLHEVYLLVDGLRSISRRLTALENVVYRDTDP